MVRVEVDVEVGGRESKWVMKVEEYVNIMVLVLLNPGNIFYRWKVLPDLAFRDSFMWIVA